MKRNPRRTPRPSTRLGRWRTSTVAHLRKWFAGSGRRVQISLMCGAAYKVGEYGTALVLTWLISR